MSADIVKWHERRAEWFRRNAQKRAGPEGNDEFMLAEIADLRAQNEALRVDAERYRWLLANYARGDGYNDIDAALNDGEPDKYLSPAIDAAIRAMQTESKGEKG